VTAFVDLLFALPAVAGLWKRFRTFRDRRSNTSLTILSIGDVNTCRAPQAADRHQICRVCSARFTHPPTARQADEVHLQEVISPRLHYFAAWTDSGLLLGCDHLHGNVISAANCISEGGGYVVAVQNGRLRALKETEEKLFQMALYGACISSRRWAVFEPLRIPKSVVN
jgi:hypothetical protein